MDDNPRVQPPTNDRFTTLPSGKRINLLRVAKIQRLLLLLILAMIGCYIAMLTVSRVLPPQFAPLIVMCVTIIYWVLVITSIVTTVRLALALGGNVVMACLGGVAMLIPVIGLILLAVRNARASHVLKQHGVRVGLLGVPPEEMHKLRLGGCSACGYSLAGLPAGNCPECGTVFTPPTSPTSV